MKTSIFFLAFLTAINLTSFAQRNTGSDRTPTDPPIRDKSGIIERNPEKERQTITTPDRQKNPTTVTPPSPPPPQNYNPAPIVVHPKHPHKPIYRPIKEPVLPIIVDNPIVVIDEAPIETSFNDMSLAEVYDLGISKLNNELYTQAIECFNFLLEDDPLDYEVYCLRGRAYHGMQMYERAIKDYKISIKIDSSYAESYYYMGITDLQLGEKQEAIKNFEIASELGFDQAEAILRKYFR